MGRILQGEGRGGGRLAKTGLPRGKGIHFVTAGNMPRCYVVGMDNSAFVAINRFGFGRRPDEPLPAAPRDWLRAQLTGPDTTPTDGLPDTADGLAAAQAQVADLKMAKEARADQAAGAAPGGADKTVMDKPARPVGELAQREIRALLDRALTTDAPYRERLVWFWANHFTVADKALIVSATSGAYIREAIRPHVTGRFSDMLLAVMRHPAMLNYLNQAQSAGPDSMAGQRRHLGLNENLARECLELHTVTPASGYTQADVTNFARVLTGWSIDAKQPPVGFRFRPNMHEPGEIEMMGRIWPAGEEGGIAALTWLGTHPATYHHLATKLCQHFVSDDPPRAEVARIETVLRDTQGDLGSAAAALIELPGAWQPEAKLRAPDEYVIACLRALGVPPDAVPGIGGIVGSLGEPVFQAPFPIGWPDRAADWSGPEAMLQRVDFSYGMAGRYANTDPVQLAQATLGPLLTPTTLAQIKAAGSRRDGLTLLLSSPEFQRR